MNITPQNNNLSAENRQKILEQFNIKESQIVENDFQMSQVLMWFLEPELEDEEDINMVNMFMELGVIGWNLSFFTKKEQAKALKDIKNNMLFDLASGKETDGLIAFIQSLIVRKKRYFSQFKVMIINYELENGPNKWNLRVISTPV